MFENWQGTIEINGILYEANHLIDPRLTIDGPVNILLKPRETTLNQAKNEFNKIPTGEVQITVKTYMTKRATPEFDFMAKWNDDIPMPFRTMVGKKVKETKGMVYMSLHGDITKEITPVCMKCGKPITNLVSQHFGLGPECGHHNYVNPFKTQEELEAHVREYKKELRKVIWEGWLPKSAIIEQEELYEDINNE